MSDVLAEQSLTSNDPVPENISEPVARPFLKWAGGKGHLLPELLRRVPSDIGTYFEPFLGGGALFFGLRPERAVLNDINPDVVNAFKVVREDLEPLIESLGSHRHSKKYFYKVREFDRQNDYWVRSDVDKASRLIYLNKTCFNGLYRVNSRGEFNVPFGDYENPKILDEENLRACSAALQGAELRCGTFDTLEEMTKPGDFVYCDPPYAPLSKTSSFASYTKEGFADEMHSRLAEFCARLDKRGVRFLVSNSYTDLVLNVFSAFKIEVVESPRSINSKGERRGKISEALISNYR